MILRVLNVQHAIDHLPFRDCNKTRRSLQPLTVLSGGSQSTEGCLTRHEVIVHRISVNLPAVCQGEGGLSEKFLHLAERVPPDGLVVLLQFRDSLQHEAHQHTHHSGKPSLIRIGEENLMI